MSWTVDRWEDLGTVTGKAVLIMYVTAVVGLHLGERTRWPNGPSSISPPR